jgi:hypothetical protein
MVPTLSSYEEFWPYYVSEHREPLTRQLHFTGTLLVLLSLAAGLLWDWRLLLAPPLFGYGFAWVGHFFVEHNRPATFTYPGWSLRGDFRMFRLMLLGRMGPELARADQLFPRAAAPGSGQAAPSHR